jgi:hypothetical protein
MIDLDHALGWVSETDLYKSLISITHQMIKSIEQNEFAEKAAPNESFQGKLRKQGC